jgi:hypothetical protein
MNCTIKANELFFIFFPSLLFLSFFFLMDIATNFIFLLKSSSCVFTIPYYLRSPVSSHLTTQSTCLTLLVVIALVILSTSISFRLTAGYFVFFFFLSNCAYPVNDVQVAHFCSFYSSVFLNLCSYFSIEFCYILTDFCKISSPYYWICLATKVNSK